MALDMVQSGSIQGDHEIRVFREESGSVPLRKKYHSARLWGRKRKDKNAMKINEYVMETLKNGKIN